MSDSVFSEQELNELKEVFFTEADEILDSLNEGMLSLEAGRDRDEALKNIQRHLHTLKGNSRALGFTNLNLLTHKSEDLVKTIQDGAVAADRGLIDLLFAIHDALRDSVSGYRKGGDGALEQSLIERIGNALGKPGGNGSEAAVHPKQEARPPALKEDAAHFLRVDANRVDRIMNLMGELVIGRSMVGQVFSELEERQKKDPLVKKLGDANAFIEKTLSQLQKNVMKIRMLPISQVFRKFPRVVRDLSHERKKQIELVMEGEKTEIDKSILDVIGEPLIHLVRNAIDHGIEPPEERERLGKRHAGLLKLRASHEGNQIIIEVSDDGAGMEPAKLRGKAVEKGIRTQDEVGRLSDEEALDLIFLSGFSTAEMVTDISGRGFGMDIVRTTVESLRGRIQVHSLPGEGTTFTLRLPLTLAIIRAMLFYAGDRLLALPMSSIEKITRVKDGDVQTINGRKVIRYRDRVISLITLRDTLLTPGAAYGAEEGKNRFVIVVGSGEKFFGFAVNRLVGQQELVIKSLDNHWNTVNCTAGASILGNGKVVLILDAPAVIARELRREVAAV
jgi:two-component system chemotaxis sensor kinase CheA